MTRAATKPAQKQGTCFCQGVGDFYDRFTSTSQTYAIALGDTQLDIAIETRSSDTVIFFFTGAVDRNKVKQPPVFNFRTIAKNTDASCVFISDPSLYLSDALSLGWYAGSRNAPLQTILPPVLRFIADRLGAKKRLFFGGSGGGFASLYYARALPGSLALVWNPQTIITQYYAGHVAAYARAAFDVSTQELPGCIQSDLCALYGPAPRDSRFIYIQSISDAHTDRHLKPFLDACGHALPGAAFSGWLDDGVYLHFTDWTDGHTAPPREVLLHLAEAFGARDADWSQDSIAAIMDRAEAIARADGKKP